MNLLNLAKRKVDKVYWSEIVEVKFSSEDPEKMLFKYGYNEDFRSAVFSAPKRELRKKEMQTRKAEMKKYDHPCGVSAQKKADLL